MYLHLLQMIWGGNTKLVNSNWRKWRKMRRRIKVFTVIAFLFWAKFLVFTVIRSILSLYWFPSHHSSECLFVFQWISLVKADCIVPWSLLRRCWWPHTDCFHTVLWQEAAVHRLSLILLTSCLTRSHWSTHPADQSRRQDVLVFLSRM